MTRHHPRRHGRRSNALAATLLTLLASLALAALARAQEESAPAESVAVAVPEAAPAITPAPAAEPAPPAPAPHAAPHALAPHVTPPAPAPHSAPAPHAHAPAAHAARGNPGAAVVALARLMVGNERYVEGHASHPHQDAATRRVLVGGQHPSTIVLACADSRVTPEVIFDQGLGDLFVVRVAGNTLDATTVASIEYAVEHLGASLIVVLGHHRCGAVKTALSVAPEAAGSPDLAALVSAIRPRVERWAATAAADPTLDAPVRANVDGVCEELTHRSAIVREALERDRIALIPAVYALANGRVEFWGGRSEDSDDPAVERPAREEPRADLEEATAGHP